MSLYKFIHDEQSVPSKNIIKPGIQFYMIFIQIFKQLFSAQHLCNTHKLIIIVVTMEKRLLAENH